MMIAGAACVILALGWLAYLWAKFVSIPLARALDEAFQNEKRR